MVAYFNTSLCALALCVGLGGVAMAEEVKNPLKDGPTWADLMPDVLGDVALADGSALFSVDAPVRAHDAATVPVVIRQTDTGAAITHATVVIDENPAPVAGEFTFAPSMAPLEFEMRVRVNQYSNVRVIADTADGQFMTGRFVKASGGCSAPASRDPTVALSTMGQMKLRMFGDDPQMSGTRREAQIMIRHPNYSGLQRDQITQLFVPAHFIDQIEVWQGDEMLFSMTGGISISENPVFRFGYTDNGAQHLTVKAKDTEGNVFERQLSKTAES